ncbi:hypothetical protein AB4160_00070 [Shewanella sp. 10N.286.51.B8]|uniref:hypothetical protein n=1 Tax=Shewanella sp. 10N.286.51.B8 TaxID=3229708 RepID=UPI003550CE57
MKSLNYARLQQLISEPINSWRALPGAILTYFKTVIGKLTVAQKLYFIAFLLMLVFDGFTLVAIIAMIAMMVEFWPLFTKTWHSLAGKAFLLLFYAVIANFSLVWAGTVVNEVTGISAQHLAYTHNLVVLLYMPVWFVVISGIALMLLQFAIPLYFVFRPFFKLVGVKAISFTNSEHYRKRTILLRVILAYIVLTNILLLGDFEHSFDSIDPKARMASLLKEEASVQGRNVVKAPEPTTQEPIPAKPIAEEKIPQELEQLVKDMTGNSIAEINQGNLAPADITADLAEPTSEQSTEDIEAADSFNINFSDENTERRYDLVREAYRVLVRSMVAGFVYYFEADQFSRCEHIKDSKVVELNDYEILEISADKEKGKYGYTFTVKQCISPAFPASYYSAQ